MKKLTITLVPKDESGTARIKKFAEHNKMPFGGKTTLNKDGTAVFTWEGRLVRAFGDGIQIKLTKELDKAIEDKGNLTYTVDVED